MPPIAVNPPALAAPSGYSHGTLSGTTLYLGGQTALDAGMRIVPGGIVEQFRQAFGNVLTTLREAGGEPEDRVRRRSRFRPPLEPSVMFSPVAHRSRSRARRRAPVLTVVLALL
ncbi:RidA family protein, partial [Actinospica durhamensis]